MEITLDLLLNNYACKPAIHAFKTKFSPTFRASAEDVFAAVAELGQTEWLLWLVRELPGFTQAINGQTHGNYTVVADGAPQDGTTQEVMQGTVIACGSSVVRAGGTTMVYALDDTEVSAIQWCRIEARHRAKVFAWDRTIIRAFDEAQIMAASNVTVALYNRATLEARNYVTATVCHDTKTAAYDHVTIRAYQGTTVDAHDQVTVILEEYSHNPIINLHSPHACIVDRRQGYATLINGPLLAESDEGKALLEIKMNPDAIPTRPLSLHP